MGILKRFFSKNGLDGFSKTVTNVADPVDPQDAATKSFSSNASNLTTGTVPGSVTPAYTGDVTKPAGSTALTLANSGATAGTYKSVTVDAKGRVTAGSNPTTLAGYGITDAAPSSHVGATGTAHGNATTSVAGFMSSTDKTKLDGIAAGANNYVHPTGDGNSHIPVTGTGSNGKVLAAGSTANSAAWVTLDLTYLPDAAFKKSVRVATTANITLSGLQTIDGITTVANDRVLVKDQTTASQNGIYLASAAAWTRVPDANTASTIAGACVNVDSGTVNGGLRFDTDFKATDTLNTTAMSWNRVLDTGLASSVVGSAPGTAAVGTSLNYARADHVHPLQTTVSGNAGTATKLATARNINGVAFDGSANITINAVDSTARIASSEKGVANGVATLDANGLVPSNQLPSYVDDVLEYAAFANFPATGTASVIYVDNSTNKIYRWSGSAYIEISPVAGNADTATKLATARTIATSGDATGTATSFDGTANIAIPLTLAASGVTAGTYNNSATAITPYTVDAKGRITGTGAAVTITPAWSSITSKPTTLAGYGITDAASSTHNHTGTYQPLDADLTAIAALAGTSGLLKKTAADTWALDTSTYLTGNQTVTLSGDATGSGTTAIAVTLAASGVTAGTYNNSATTVTPITVDAKGRVTGTGAAVTLTPAWSSITSKPTTLAGYGITDAQAAIAAGTTAQFWRGDKTWQDIATAVRAVVLTGLSTATNAAIVATDSILVAAGKLQAQITALSSSLASKLGSSDIGVTVQGYDANTAKTNVSNIWTAPQRASMGTDTTGAFDLSAYQNYTSTPTAAVTLTFNNHASGVAGAIIFNNTADYAVSVAATTKITAGDLAKLQSTGVYRIDYIDDGTNAYCSVTGGY